MISFMSEHTVEYALVGDIVSRLKSAFPNVSPIYLWLNREGNSMGLKAFEGKEVKLVAVFPRRPKVNHPGQDHILVKCISAVLCHAFRARAVGIPVLAGVPLISDLSSFRIDSECRWFIVDGSMSGKRDLEILLSKSGEIVDHKGSLNTVRGPSKTSEIVQEIKKIALENSWGFWLHIIREIRMRLDEQGYPWSLGSYKPFYLVIL